MFIVTQVQSSKEKEELLKQFKAFDKNNDGTLSREEIIEGINLIYSSFCTVYDPVKAETI